MFVTSTTTSMENEKQTRSDPELNLIRQQSCEDRQEQDIGQGIGI